MRFDLHVHSKYSMDSPMEPVRIVETAKVRGLGGMAVVDHGSVRGGLEAAECAGDDFIVIPGMEITTCIGHLIGLFLSRPVEATDPAQVIAEIHEQEGIAVLPHPLRTLADVPENILQELDALETHNSRSGAASTPLAKRRREKLRQLAERYGLAPLGGSDAHFYAEIGRGITEIDATTAQDVKAAILEEKTRAEGTRTSLVYRFMSGVLRVTSA